MDAGVISLIQDMASSSFAFIGSFVTNLWGLLLSLAVLLGVGGFIYRRVTRVGQ